MLKLSIISECSYSIIKLTQDALKELIEINSCKYCVEVATHLKVHVIGQTLYCMNVVNVIKIEELVKSFNSYQQGEIIVGLVVIDY